MATGKIAFYSTPYLNQQIVKDLPFSRPFTMDPVAGLYPENTILILKLGQCPGKAGQNCVVLIFEVWHPDLTEKEQAAISATFEARTKWLENRSV